jgi:hypothetical protein
MTLYIDSTPDADCSNSILAELYFPKFLYTKGQYENAPNKILKVREDFVNGK